VSRNNAGTGFLICPQSLSSRSRPVSIYLEHCVSRGNQQHAVHLCSAPKDPPGGLLQITRLVSEGDGMAGLSVQFNPYDGMRVSLENSIIRDSARNEKFFPPLYVQGLDAERPAGNVHFKNVLVKDEVERPFFKVRVRNSNEVKNITGDIVLQRKGRKERITLDEAWLEKNSSQAPAKK